MSFPIESVAKRFLLQLLLHLFAVAKSESDVRLAEVSMPVN